MSCQHSQAIQASTASQSVRWHDDAPPSLYPDDPSPCRPTFIYTYSLSTFVSFFTILRYRRVRAQREPVVS